MRLPKAHPVRRVIRELLAIAFWMHAAWVLSLPPASLAAITPTAIRGLYNAALVLFILYYSYFSDRGWFSVMNDLGYVYFWPFAMVARILWGTGKLLFEFFRANLIIPKVGLIVEAKALPAAQTPKVDAPQNLKTVRPTKLDRPLILRLARPLTQFCLLWAALVLTTDNRGFLLFASVVALAGASRTMVMLWNLRANNVSWVRQLKDKFTDQLRARIALVEAWQEGSDAKDVTAEVNALKLYDAFFMFFEENKDFLTKCAIAISVAITIPFYCYISLLFSLVYVGVSKFQGIDWPWTNAITTSLFIPFAYTDLPHNLTIRLLGGLQAVAVTIMGWNIVSRHLTNRLKSIVSTAAELRQPITEQTVRSKMLMITMLKSDAAPKDGHAAQVAISATPTKNQPRSTNKGKQLGKAGILAAKRSAS